MVASIRLGNALSALWADAGSLFRKQFRSCLFLLQPLNLCWVHVKFEASLALMPGTPVLGACLGLTKIAYHSGTVWPVAIMSLATAAAWMRTGNVVAGSQSLLLQVLVTFVDFLTCVLLDVSRAELLGTDGTCEYVEGTCLNNAGDG